MIYLIEIVHIHDECFEQIEVEFFGPNGHEQPAGREAVILDLCWLYMKWLGLTALLEYCQVLPLGDSTLLPLSARDHCYHFG